MFSPSKTLVFFGLQVNARWLLDLEEFNEWMNEEDYLNEDEVSKKEIKKSFLLILVLLKHNLKASKLHYDSHIVSEADLSAKLLCVVSAFKLKYFHCSKIHGAAEILATYTPRNTSHIMV